MATGECQFQGAGDLLASDNTKAAANKRVLHRSDHHVEFVEATGRHDYRIFEPSRLTRLAQPVSVRLGVRKLQRIVREQVGKVFIVATQIEKRCQAFGGPYPEMVSAFGAYIEAGFQVFLVDQLGTARTLDPQAFWHPAWFFGRLR